MLKMMDVYSPSNCINSVTNKQPQEGSCFFHGFTPTHKSSEALLIPRTSW